MKKICKESFIYTIIAVVYIALVAILMNNGDKIFGKADTVFSVVAFLLLFTLSALIMGVLLVGKPLMLFLDGKKKDAIYMVAASAGWMLLYLILALLISVIV